MHDFDTRWRIREPGSGTRPVFLLSAGWRSGSTLLQRLVCSSREVLVWGEAYGRAGLIPALRECASALGESWPNDGHFPPEPVFEQLSSHWIANLYPPPAAFRRALAAPLVELLERPARERGFERFGLKEVRLDARDARFLEWLYPDARFLFLVRNPWDAWSSARGMTWIERWPDDVVRSAREFAAHWRKLAESFLDWPQENGLLVRYEDLREPAFDLEPIRRHLQLDAIDASVRDVVLRGITKPRAPLPPDEVELVAGIAGEAAEVLGYAGPRDTRAFAAATARSSS